MEEVQRLIEELRKRGWTFAAIADELEVNRETVSRLGGEYLSGDDTKESPGYKRNRGVTHQTPPKEHGVFSIAGYQVISARRLKTWISKF
jgi:predicted transcriptional regulator